MTVVSNSRNQQHEGGEVKGVFSLIAWIAVTVIITWLVYVWVLR
jgi:hypothetical protein